MLSSLSIWNIRCLIMCCKYCLHFSSRLCFVTKQEIEFFPCTDIVSYFLLLLLVCDWPSVRCRLLRGPRYSPFPAGRGSPHSPSMNQIPRGESWTGRPDEIGEQVTRAYSISLGMWGPPSAWEIQNKSLSQPLTFWKIGRSDNCAWNLRILKDYVDLL